MMPKLCVFSMLGLGTSLEIQSIYCESVLLNRLKSRASDCLPRRVVPNISVAYLHALVFSSKLVCSNLSFSILLIMVFCI